MGPRALKGPLSLCPRPVLASVFQVSNSQCPIPFLLPQTMKRATNRTKRDRMSFVVGWVRRGTLKLPFWTLRTAQATGRGLVLAQGLIDAGGVEG